VEPDSFGLFEVETAAPARPSRAQRGRNRETWTGATTATVAIRDHDSINDAFAELEEAAYVLGELEEPVPEDAERLSPMGQVAWLVWPTAGMDRALEADAFRILSVEAEVLEDEGDRGTLRWTVTVKVRNVDQLRRLAVESCPEDAEAVADSFAVAWQRAVDPFAPIRAVPGIDWQPGTVEVTHVPARA
jgi:hypothetical protein